MGFAVGSTHPTGTCRSGPSTGSGRASAASSCRQFGEKPKSSRLKPPPRESGEPSAHSCKDQLFRSEEHTSELQSLMRISSAVLCLKKKKTYNHLSHP